MNKSKFANQLYFNTPTYLIKDKNDLDVFLNLAKEKGAKRLLKRYYKDFQILVEIDCVDVRFSEFKNEMKSLYPIFLYKKNNKLFRFAPVNVKCKKCSFEIYGGLVSSFDVQLGIEDKKHFLKQQSELKDVYCPSCGVVLKGIKFLFSDLCQNNKPVF
ncbi:hypothetical protein PPO43_00485 [Saprospira sp. CCB-QB6]|uniref:hypothetical protein n=1 Tax=Saprospira sp. CCB-QB6 TaxID=3023936 RepID=UPI00234ABC96|nr:hypothetical protein [Saprospira sp. CCB-QB6]WCL81573.1 hypothetical protein PPO43_00485 [Saprospira sp. CCB-QB6]